jgi:uncharacterized membrane protein
MNKYTTIVLFGTLLGIWMLVLFIMPLLIMKSLFESNMFMILLAYFIYFFGLSEFAILTHKMIEYYQEK